jgi:hypothetical protein
MGKMKAFDVYLAGHRIDTVWFNSVDADEVRQSLIAWDGYDPEITVEDVEKSLRPA